MLCKEYAGGAPTALWVVVGGWLFYRHVAEQVAHLMLSIKSASLTCPAHVPRICDAAEQLEQLPVRHSGHGSVRGRLG